MISRAYDVLDHSFEVIDPDRAPVDLREALRVYIGDCVDYCPEVDISGQ